MSEYSQSFVEKLQLPQPNHFNEGLTQIDGQYTTRLLMGSGLCT